MMNPECTQHTKHLQTRRIIQLWETISKSPTNLSFKTHVDVWATREALYPSKQSVICSPSRCRTCVHVMLRSSCSYCKWVIQTYLAISFRCRLNQQMIQFWGERGGDGSGWRRRNLRLALLQGREYYQSSFTFHSISFRWDWIYLPCASNCLYNSPINLFSVSLLRHKYLISPSLMFDSQLPSHFPHPRSSMRGLRQFSPTFQLPPSSKDFGGRRTLAHSLACFKSWLQN